MATAFKSVNTTMSFDPSKDDVMATSPTTPRRASHPLSPQLPTVDDATTPTKASFASSALASQKPLPTSPFPEAVQIPESTDDDMPKRANSQISRKSRDSDEMDMDESGDEGEDVGSDDESVNADGTKSSKKKKSQRFFCTDYPPCNLSFTRSEHLARHIRKHTGERPFQCHCSRRFSRLDNLRQHAQTVHVNEDIPMDSLAATGTRFQRQIRTDRVRPNGGRARASTAGSIGGPGRGHSKSLSTSSIASIGSVGSNYSSRDEIRRRPPPLVMATTPQARLSLESYHSAADSQFSYRPPSPGDFSTPTSATFSTGQSSPRWSTIASPSASHSRSQSIYATGARTPGRRLSVPSGGNPFTSPHGANIGRPIFAAAPLNAAPPISAFPPSPAGSLLASPTAPGNGWLRRESMSSAADEAWRRRTWHPDSREFVTNSSRLSTVITPAAYPSHETPPPISDPPQQQTSLRLPGIESFDAIPGHSHSPTRRAPSPMLVDSEPAPNPHSLHAIADAAASDERRSWDMGLHRGLNRLEIASTTPPRDSAGTWAHEALSAVQARAEQARAPPTVRFENEAQVVQIPANPPPTSGFTRGHAHTMSAPTGTPREYKRHGWYHGPVTVTSSAAPGDGDKGHRVERMVHPNLANGFQGFPARVPQTVPEAVTEHPNGSDSMRRLEALVAVATKEGEAAAAY